MWLVTPSDISSNFWRNHLCNKNIYFYLYDKNEEKNIT